MTASSLSSTSRAGVNKHSSEEMSERTIAFALVYEFVETVAAHDSLEKREDLG